MKFLLGVWGVVCNKSMYEFTLLTEWDLVLLIRVQRGTNGDDTITVKTVNTNKAILQYSTGGARPKLAYVYIYVYIMYIHVYILCIYMYVYLFFF
jgi:hypothetical protein